ncbi:MAG: methylenetetrahydrofolate reductase [NAD(P)H] [Candidatus Fimivivens sp.]
MKISEICRKKPLTFSLEIFPPKRDRPVESLYATMDRLSSLNPDYISVTYGAGGSPEQQKTTCALVSHIQNNCGITPLAHLTCINSTRSQVDAMLDALEREKIENILALRGDSVDDAEISSHFMHATDLIAHISARGGFDIAAACYPEGHPESESTSQDIKFLKEKVTLGASHLISQLFFDNEDFLSMAELCDKENIKVPIQAGIMPVVNVKQIELMVSLCGAKLPQKFTKIMARYGNNPKALFDAGLCYATEQIVDLIASGVSGIHLYTMNNPIIAETIHKNIANILDSSNGEAP